jgi:hypothetical protein
MRLKIALSTPSLFCYLLKLFGFSEAFIPLGKGPKGLDFGWRRWWHHLRFSGFLPKRLKTNALLTGLLYAILVPVAGYYDFFLAGESKTPIPSPCQGFLTFQVHKNKK